MCRVLRAATTDGSQPTGIGGAVVCKGGRAELSSQLWLGRSGRQSCPQGWPCAGCSDTVLAVITFLQSSSCESASPPPAPPKTPEPSSDHCINPVSLARLTLFRRSFEVSSREWLRSGPVGVQGQHPCLLPAAPAAAWPPGFRPAGLHAALRARAGGVVRHRDRPPLPPALRWCSVRTLFSSFPAQSSRVPGTAWGALGRLPGTQCRISGMRG